MILTALCSKKEVMSLRVDQLNNLRAKLTKDFDLLKDLLSQLPDTEDRYMAFQRIFEAEHHAQKCIRNHLASIEYNERAAKNPG